MKIALLRYEYPPDTGFWGIGTHTWCQAHPDSALVRHRVDLWRRTLAAPSTAQGGIHRSMDPPVPGPRLV